MSTSEAMSAIRDLHPGFPTLDKSHGQKCMTPITPVKVKNKVLKG